MSTAQAGLALGLAVAASVAGAAASPPDAGWQARSIKALAPQQVEDYLAGRGMGLALPAELNGYPGPRHVLELAAALDLTPAQLAATQQLFDDMRRKAIEIGREIVAREADLDRLFAAGTASADAVREISAALGRLNGQLRAHHLGYHLAMREVLDRHQVEAYQRLRGYAAPDRPHDHRHGDPRRDGRATEPERY